jgi:peptidoglycan/xylan/chitin deacetylase (PgdA/CDA1 family)
MGMPDNTIALAAGGARSTLRELLKISDCVPEPPPVTPAIDHYLYERYVRDTHSWKRRAYYALKPVIPRRIQLALRQRFTAVQAAAAFPAWPIEPLMTRAIDTYLATLLQQAREVPRLSYWPDGCQFAFAITHDVEMDAGLRRAPALATLEKHMGFVSSWNLVPERYPIDWAIVDRLRADGFEIGMHGLKHDGRLFQSYTLYEKRIAKIHSYAREWGASGFRSPSTLRNAAWMTELKFDYDSSFPDTDPYEPQAGGCCSLWPYFIGDMVELPLTMPQDHTLFEILNHRDIRIWREKVMWIAAQGGLVVLNVHPDYMMDDTRFALYEEFLHFMKAQSGMWHVLPREISRWWRDRNRSMVRDNGIGLIIEGPAAGRASIVRHVLRDGIVTAVTQTGAKR